VRKANDALVVAVVRSIQERVGSGELPAGTHLKQETLARDYDVSRMPIRQALEQLRVRGLVEIVPHRGAFVRGPSPRDIREAYLVRAELEGVAAARAAEFVTESQLERLGDAERLFEQAIEGLKRKRSGPGARSGPRSRAAPDAREWGQANDVFHEVLLEAACNDRLRQVVATLHESFPRSLTWSVLNDDVRLLSENVTQHRQIREAVERGDGPTARSLMVAHIMGAGDLIAMRATYMRDGTNDA
jgi:DNA-binding GntR family transcriptional regulator